MPAELPKQASEWNHKIFSIGENNFADCALAAFAYQYAGNSIYAAFAKAVGRHPGNVHAVTDIPFLPISFFKTHTVVTGNFSPEAVFESSGTTGSINSRHLVKSLNRYRNSFNHAFQRFYGSPADYCILALLPSYLERNNSSLVVMAADLIAQSGHPQSGFYLNNRQELAHMLQSLEAVEQKTLLLGVTFALLDFAADFPMKLNHTIIMETGGMKGRREEWTRAQVHDFLTAQLGPSAIHSEYGMTELLSQAYSTGNGLFQCPPWMKVMVRAEDDPLSVMPSGRGILNVIDLANLDSCCFIATEDAGDVEAGGKFYVIGRTDNSDLRGCSLMAL